MVIELRVWISGELRLILPRLSSLVYCIEDGKEWDSPSVETVAK